MPKKTTASTQAPQKRTAPDQQLTAIRKIIQALDGLSTGSQLTALKFVEERVYLARAEETKRDYLETRRPVVDQLRGGELGDLRSVTDNLRTTVGGGLRAATPEELKFLAEKQASQNYLNGLAKCSDPVRG